MIARRRFIMMAPAFVAGCAGLGGLGTVLLDEQQIASLLSREFPRQHRVMELLDVTVAAPRVRLLPDRNRIATDLDFTAAERLTGRPLRGFMALDYALRLEPGDGTVRLSQVRVDRVNFESGARMLPLPAQRLGGLLAEQLLNEAVIWRARPEQLQYIRMLGANAGAVNVTPRGVEIRLAPGLL